MSVAGFVLVGGRSARMGRDKARLLVDEKPMAEAAATQLAAITDSVHFLGNPASYADFSYECIPDLRPGLGPLAALESALAARRADLNVILGCDMPGLQPQWLIDLVATARCSAELCVVAKDSAGRIHPLCAVYRSDCLPFVQRALNAKRLRLLELITDLHAVEMQVNAVIANLNTPDQLHDWRSRLSA